MADLNPNLFLQLMVERRVVNLWDRDHCASPCVDNGPCPHNSKCVDLRGVLAPEWECVCQMGMEMVGGRSVTCTQYFLSRTPTNFDILTS